MKLLDAKRVSSLSSPWPFSTIGVTLMSIATFVLGTSLLVPSDSVTAQDNQARDSEQSDMSKNSSRALDMTALHAAKQALQNVPSDEEYVRRAYRELLDREATPAEVEDFLKNPSGARGPLLLELVADNDKFQASPATVLDGLDGWDLPKIDSPPLILRLTKRAGRRTRGEIRPGLVIYEDGTVVVPVRQPRQASVGRLSETELAHLLREITEEQKFFSLHIRPSDSIHELNRDKPDFDEQVNIWNSGSLQIWVRGDDGWHMAWAYLHAWANREEPQNWPDEIKALASIDQRLSEIMQRFRQ